MKVIEAISMFVEEQKFRGNSKETIKDYGIKLRIFSDFCGRDTDIDDLSVMIFKQYQVYLMEQRNLKRVSVQSYARDVRVFLRWLYFEDMLDIDINRLRLVKSQKDVIQPLNDLESKKLLNMFNESVWLDLRNKLMCMLMLDCGLRRGEIVKLDIDDVDLKNCTMLINGKGSKQRIVPFGSTTFHLLKKYIKCTALTRGTLFRNQDGTPITDNTLKMLFSRLKSKSGITRLYPHLLRHTFATNYILNGGNLEVLRVLMGHSTIQITQVYVHLAAQMRIISEKHLSHVDDMLVHKKEPTTMK